MISVRWMPRARGSILAGGQDAGGVIQRRMLVKGHLLRGLWPSGRPLSWLNSVARSHSEVQEPLCPPPLPVVGKGESSTLDPPSQRKPAGLAAGSRLCPDHRTMPGETTGLGREPRVCQPSRPRAMIPGPLGTVLVLPTKWQHRVTHPSQRWRLRK